MPSNPSSPSLTRRTLLKQAGLGALSLPFFNLAASGTASAATVTSSTPAPATPDSPHPLNRFGRMMQEYYVTRLRDIEKSGNDRRAALRTRDDAEAYVLDAREKISRCFGPFPEKTPLNSRVTGVVERDAYRIEKIVFESRPGFPVTANLYVPKGRSQPLPGVVGTCGHTASGKAGETYQSFAQGLARLGYLTLLYDPIGQGERVQLLGPDLRPRHGVSVDEHVYLAHQQFLVGEFFGSWLVWDGIRALDYLLTRPEVDPHHVGVTGNSGGGTQTTWLSALEPRWTMAAASCFVTTLRRNLENELPSDSEQCPPHTLALGLDHSDFIAAHAPRPIIMMGQEKDYFDVRGLEEAFARLKRLYRLLGSEENIQIYVGPDHHGFSQPNREAMYGWFNQHANPAASAKEPPLTIEKEETLWCTPHGQVGESAPRNVFSFTRDRAHTLARQRGFLDAAALTSAIERILHLAPRTGVPDYRILRPSPERGYPKTFAATYAVETEPGITALVYRLSDTMLLSRPPRGFKRAILYISHHSADAELRTEPLLRELIQTEPESAFFACDVRGIGESLPNTCARDYLAPYGNDYFYAIHGVMLDSPYVGQKTFDVLRVINWLKSNGHNEIHLVANGWGAIPATFAAVLSDDVKQVTLKHALTSYQTIAESEDYQWPLSSLVPGILKEFDLPDCYRALAAKSLQQLEPVGALG